MAGRTVQYNVLTTPEKLQQVNPDNVELGNDFLDYLVSVDRARSTIDASLINSIYIILREYDRILKMQL